MCRVMGIKTLAYFMIWCSFLIQYGISGLQISKQEELQWNKEFELLKKPSVKTIKTKYGAIYDCVDFYKQPAFDHPLLKNHSSHTQIRPSFNPEWLEARSNFTTGGSMMLEDGGCPLGTVPIRRLNKHEFFQIKQFTKDYASRSNPNFIEDQPGTHRSIVQTNSDIREVDYHGVRCEFNVYAPNVTQPQYSMGEMIIQSFEDQIQVGWIVNPGLNKDNLPHLFQYINAGQSHCFNTLCPGFVSTNPRYPIDIAYVGGASVRGGQQRTMQTSVYQDPKTGNWWLEVQDGVFSYVIVGYWPKEIFTGLGDSASYIAVGGEAYSPPDQPLAPMGNGYFPIQDASKTAYCTDFAVLDGNHKKINPSQTETLTYDSSYGVSDIQNYAHLGRTVFFGGPTRD